MRPVWISSRAIRRRPRARAALVAVFLVGTIPAGCASYDAHPPVIVEEREWTSPSGVPAFQLFTDHYDLRVTSADAPLRAHLGPFMETAYAEYRKLIPPAQERPDRMTMYVFGTRHEWAGFTKSAFPAQAHTYLHIHSGGYVDHASAVGVLYDVGRDLTLSLTAHEGFHQYLAAHFPLPVPPWINEGLATQWEAFELDGDRPAFTPRRNLLRKHSLREALIAENGLIALPELLGMHAGQAVVQVGQATRAYYAQVWSLVLFLREGDEKAYREGFDRLLADAGTKRLHLAISAYRAATPGAESMSNGEAAFRQYITDDLEAFEADYHAFARYLVN